MVVGFPKSMNIGKGIEAKEKLGNAGTRNKRKIEQSCDGEAYTIKQTNNGAMGEVIETTRKEYVPSTELSNKWSGWGTCLKPSFEPIIVARKPFKGSLVDNVIENGVGGLNIDECRVGNDVIKGGTMPKMNSQSDGINIYNFGKKDAERLEREDNIGRFPANTILTYDETDFDEVCGGFPNTKSGSKMTFGCIRKKQPDNCYKLGFSQKDYNDGQKAPDNYGDSGSASRYFYCAKASKKDRDEGLEDFDYNKVKVTNFLEIPRDDGSIRQTPLRRNIHPTVKPTNLMQYLVRLVSPKGATILDPFNGSGSTGKAVMYENLERNANYKYIGIELTDEYLPISKARIEYVCNLPRKEEEKKDKQITIDDILTEE